MACYYPIDAWRGKTPNAKGKYPVVFKRSEAQQDDPLKLPCNKCIGCRLQHAQAWGIRCHHEMQQYDDNCFITLTYDQENLPNDESIHKRHLQTFFKRLRKALSPKKIRYFACGEYGTDQDPNTADQLGRPHYHAIIFNHDFEDKILHKTVRDNPLYTSEQLSTLWGKGISTVQDANFKTAQYTAGYVIKKLGGEFSEKHYQKVNKQTGEITNVHPEFMLCSTRPGIGYNWAKQYLSDLDKGFITFQGKKIPYPKYYDTVYKNLNPEKHMFLCDNKKNRVDQLDPDYTLDRLRVKEKIQKTRTQTLTQRNDIT